MKKTKILLLLLCFALSLFGFTPYTAFAVTLPFEPIYGLYLIDKTADFSVLSETLTIAPPAVLNETPHIPNMPKELNARYEIRNGGEAKAARVALPVIERINSDFDGYTLTANGVALSPRVHYTDVSPLFFNDFDNLFSYAFADAVVYDESLAGVLYEITAPTAVEVSFTLGTDQKILHSANYSYYNSGTRSFALGGSEGIITIFLNAGTLDIACSTMGASISAEAVSYNDFLALFAGLESEIGDGTPYAAFAAHAFDKRFINGNADALDLYDLFPPQNGLILLVYDIDFVAGANTVIINRPVPYTLYKTAPLQYALHFVSLPYRSWASFGTTNISVTTPSDLPYILSAGFEKTAANTYSFNGNLVSGADGYYVVFSSVENPTAPRPPVWRTVLLVVCIVVGSLAFAWLIISVILILRDKRRKV